MAMLVFCYTPAQRTINQTKHFPDPNRKHLIQMLNSTYPLKRDKEAEDTNRVWITRECLKKHTAEDVQYRRPHSSDLSLAGNNCDHRPEPLSCRDPARRPVRSVFDQPGPCPASARLAPLPSPAAGAAACVGLCCPPAAAARTAAPGRGRPPGWHGGRSGWARRGVGGTAVRDTGTSQLSVSPSKALSWCPCPWQGLELGDV